MDLFRRKQKLIFWIVTIIIVPSFVLVWGVGGLDGGGGQSANDFTLGSIDGNAVNMQEFEAFRNRIQAAIGGIPLQFPSAPGVGSPLEEHYKYLLTYALLKDAQKAGVSASPSQVGTYLEKSHPTLAASYRPDDPQALERAVDGLCRQLQLSRQEFLRGVKEWQIIANYLAADSNFAAVNDETVFAMYALTKAEMGVKRIRVLETDDIREQAKREVMEKPAEELEREVRAFIESRTNDPRYRDPAAWRFAYIVVPNVAESSVRVPSEAELQEQYDAGKAALYGDKPMAEVLDQVRADLIAREIDTQTLRNFNIDVDPQLRGQGLEMAPSELVKLTQLAKYGVTHGDTGAEPLTADELLKKLPPGAGTEIRVLLDTVDGDTTGMREMFMTEWRAGYQQALRPFKADNGYFRLRLLDYLPSTPAMIDGEDGKIKPELFEMAAADMVGERADELVAARTTELEDQLRALLAARKSGADAPDATLAGELDELPMETVTYATVPQNQAELGRLTVPDVFGPIPSTGGEPGLELVVLMERRIPARADFDAETADIKSGFRQMVRNNLRGSSGFTYTAQGPAAIIQPGPVVMGGIADRFNRQQIALDSELVEELSREVSQEG